LRARKIKPQGWQAPQAEVSHLLQKAPFGPLVKSLRKGGRVMALALPGFEGLLSRNTQPHTPFLQEFADRVRVVACLQECPNLLCSDTDAQLLKPGQWSKIQKALGVGASAVVVLVWGQVGDVRTAAKEIEIRAVEAMEGVPSETRQALADGTNGFERILPGPDRMYPDTDLPPMAISQLRRDEIRKKLPEPPWERIGRYARVGVSEGLSRELILCGRAELFDRVLEGTSEIRPSLAAYMLVCKWKAAKRRGLPVGSLSGHFWEELFRLAGQRGWAKEVVYDLLGRALAEGRDLTREEMLQLAPAALETDQLRQRVEQAMSRSAFHPRKGGRPETDRRRGHAMGVAMSEVRGRAEGRTIRECVERLAGCLAPEGEAA